MPPFLAPRPGPPRRAASRPVPLRLWLRLVLARHRRAVVAALVALAVASGVWALRPARPPTTRVLVAARDLPAGHRLTARDLTARPWPAGATPAGLVARPQGQVLAAAMRRGEPVTDVRVATGGRSTAGGRLPAGWVAVTVRLTDPATTQLVAPGDRVEVIAGAATDPLAGASSAGAEAGATARAARVVVDDAVVLTTPASTPAGEASGHPSGAAGDGSSGARLLGAFGGAPSAAGGTAGDGGSGDGGGLPAGVLVLGLPDDAAVDLAAVSGVRSLTIARKTPEPG